MLRLTLLIFIVLVRPAEAQTGVEADRQAISAVIGGWYSELAKVEDGYRYRYTAPGLIDATPAVDYVDTGAAVLGPPIYTSLAARAMQFSYEITDLRADTSFAKARVWERGYFYAAAASETYELAASTLFLLERDVASGRWLIIAHRSGSVGIPDSMKTDPMPDLRNRWMERSTLDFLLPAAQ